MFDTFDQYLLTLLRREDFRGLEINTQIEDEAVLPLTADLHVTCVSKGDDMFVERRMSELLVL